VKNNNMEILIPDEVVLDKIYLIRGQKVMLDRDHVNLRSQSVTSNWGGSRYVPMAFTEQGIAMISSVLNSKQAIQVNIHIFSLFFFSDTNDSLSELQTEIHNIVLC
jgi:hypothetical protein